MKQECFANRNKVLDDFRRKFGVTGDVMRLTGRMSRTWLSSN